MSLRDSCTTFSLLLGTFFVFASGVARGHGGASEEKQLSSAERDTDAGRSKSADRNGEGGRTKQSDGERDKKKVPPKPFSWVNPLPKGHHPALRHGTFCSPSMKVDVGYAILLPPSYAESTRRFPVVYYLHGGRPGSEAKGHKLAAMIFDQMKASCPDEDRIYVFVNGGPVSHYNLPGEAGKQGADVFIHELIPHVDATYRTIADRQSRGVEGFSQGGRGTMRLSLRYPELFSTAAAGGGGYETEKKISESGGYENPSLKFADGDNVWDLARAYASEDRPAVRWLIYVGDKGFNYPNNLRYMEFLDAQEIPYRRLVVPGVEHSAKGIYEKEAATIVRFHASDQNR